MNFKKRVNGSWADIPHYIHKTATDTITTLPAVLYPTGSTATVGLKGQAVQSGTPTPQNPIMPEGTGERTGNWFDYTSLAMQRNAYIDDNGNLVTTGTTASVAIIYWSWVPVSELTEYCMSCATSRPWTRVYFYDSNKNFLSRSSADNTENTAKSFTTPTNCAYVNFQEWTGNSPSNELNTVMLNLGSTPLPYEPYGYKIPISSASSTTSIYLGEVQSTRRIKKLVLDGTENWTYEEAYSRFWINVADFTTVGLCLTPFISNSFGSISDGRPIAGVPNNTIYSGSWGGVDTHKIFIKTTEYTSVADFKSYLAAQYAAGTPVTVWYVLATPETAVVNKPLMKIGDYADTLSNVTIPVTAGGDTISVDTTVQPSEVTVNYKGWHPAIVHQRTNGAWT